MKITVIGTGYVGLTTGLTFSAIGHEVVGVDKDPAKLDMLRSGQSPIHEEGMNRLLQSLQSQVAFTDDLVGSVADADVIIIAVGTPPKATGEADTQFVEAAAVEIASGLVDGGEYTLVVKSTVPIGTNKRLSHLIRRELEERGVNITVHITSNPEFLREGKALPDSFYPDRIVIGTLDPRAEDTLYHLYKPLLEQRFTPPSFIPRPEGLPLPRLVTTDPTSAEISKYASNAFLAVKISFINEMAGLCERVGADVEQVADVMGMDHRIGRHFLNAGLGWGGSCLPKDTSALQAVASEYEYEMLMIEASRQVNFGQRQAVIEKIQAAVKVLRGQTIGVLGAAFKPKTDDVRDSAAIELIRLLDARGAHCRVHDPIALANAKIALGEDVSVDFVEEIYDLPRGADALLVATEWADYADLDWKKMTSEMENPILIDARNLLNPAEMQAAGFQYFSIGR